MGNLVFLLKRDDWTGLVVRCLLLSAVLMFSLGIGLIIASFTGLYATCLNAFALVLVCSVAGLFAGEFPRGPEFAILRLVGSIFSRTGLLLFFLLLVRKWDLLNHAFIYYILAFYAIGLLTDVSLTSLKSWQGTPSGTNKNYRSSELAAN